MSEQSSYYPELAKKISKPGGKLGVLLPGLGAVSTTFIAGVHLARKGIAQPYGSLTQMQRIRLGKRTNPRFPLIKELVPLADLKDFVFGGWDIYKDSSYEAAVKAGVLAPETLRPIQSELSKIKPMPAVFQKDFVKKLDGPNVKLAKSKMHLAEALQYRAYESCRRTA